VQPSVNQVSDQKRTAEDSWNAPCCCCRYHTHITLCFYIIIQIVF